MWIWLAVIFVAAAGVGVILAREPFARLEGNLAGGTVPPGCVTAQGVLLLILAILIVVLSVNGLL